MGNKPKMRSRRYYSASMNLNAFSKIFAHAQWTGVIDLQEIRRSASITIYNTTLLSNANTLIARGMFCGAKYTHHTLLLLSARVLAERIAVFHWY